MKINDIVESIHGEAPFSGQPTLIVRFSGCNLSCSFCDTSHETYTDRTLEDVVQVIRDSKLYNILFTGGEPLLHIEDIEEVMKALGVKYTYIIETNGTIAPSPYLIARAIIVMDIKEDNSELSSTHKLILRELSHEDVVKFVYTTPEALRVQFMNFLEAVKWNPIAQFVFSPSPEMYEKSGPLVRLLLEYQKNYPEVDVRLQIQLHKILKVA